MKKQAFTLIELLVVIVIIGILSGVGISAYNGYVDKARFAKAVATYKQFSNVAQAKEASSEEVFFGGWYSFDNSGDVNYRRSDSDRDLVTDNSEAGRGLYYASRGAIMQPSDDTPLGIGKSMDSNRDSPYYYGSIPAPTNAFTMATWIKIPNFPASRQSIISFSSLRVSILSSEEIAVSHDSGGGDIVSSAIEANRWHYVIASYKDGVISFWLDGNLVGTETSSNPGANISSIIGIGGANYGSGILYDEVMIFDHAYNGQDFE